MIQELLAVESLDAFLAVLERRPELFAEAVDRELEELSESYGHGATFARALILLDGARVDPEEAWKRHRAALQQLKPLMRRLDQLGRETEVAARSHDFDRVIALADEAAPLASDAGFGEPTAWFLDRRGTALLARNGERRADDLEEAGRTLELAARVAIPGEQAAIALMHYGLVLMERVLGDRAENIERAIGVMEAGLRQLSDSDDPDLRSMLQTNLAVAFNRCERSDRSAVRHAAANLCRCALKHRTPERDVDDWALTTFNLGDALYGLAELDELPFDQAGAAFAAVIGREDALSRTDVAGSARYMLAQMRLAEAYPPDDDVDDDGDEIEPWVREALLRDALGHLVRAEQLLRHGPDPLRYGLILGELGNVLMLLDDEENAIACMAHALEVLRPDNSPYRCAQTATRLGNLLSRRREWAAAAAAFGDALDATETTFHSRLETSSREAEIAQSGTLHRWAAYAFARGGDPLVAAQILEAGRARELRRRIVVPSLDELDGVPAGLRAEYAAASEALIAAPLGSEGSAQARHFQEVLTAVRAQSGRPELAALAGIDEISEGIEPGWPLLYINPSPDGTSILCLTRGADAAVKAEATFLDIASTDIMLRLLAGDAADLDDPLQATSTASYLVGISGQHDEPRDFKQDLDQTLPWFGEHVARPLHHLLTAANARGATLIPCGLIAVVPLHACPLWGSRCLVDDFEVRYAPSAVVCGAAAKRAAAAEQDAPYLVAVGNPTGDLRGARPEVEEIAAQFEPEQSACAFGRDAGLPFLRAHARRATHLHFACHANGGLFDASDTAVHLATGELPATALPALGSLATRLVVVSACQSALPSVGRLPDEAFSIGTVALAAGSACVIASLWLVDDLATAILMTRLYEEMLGARHRPAEALCRAQLWLRDLSFAAEQAFLASHPALEREFQRRLTRGDAPGRRSSAARSAAGHGPYSHPDYWAPFIAVGV